MSESRKPAKLADLLASGGQNLSRLLARTRDLEDLTGKVRNGLPVPESDHVVAVSIGDEALVVTVDSAAWAPRLRFSESAIRAIIGDNCRDKKMLVKVRRPAAP